MANEFVIKNGYISQGNSVVNGDLTVTTISATTYQNLPTDIRVTGGSYVSSASTITFTNNTGGTFNVTGITTSTGTTITSTATTIGIINNVSSINLEVNAGINVIPISTSSGTVGTASNDYYLNFRVPYNLTIRSVTFSVSSTGSDQVRFGIFRGQDTTATLVGQSSASTIPTTINTFTITAQTGQNLYFIAGEWMVIGVAVGGTTTNLYGSSCPNSNNIAWFNTTDSSGGFLTNPRAKGGTVTTFPSVQLNIV